MRKRLISIIIANLAVSAILIPAHAQVDDRQRAPSGDGGLPLEPLCEPDARIPDDLVQCGTCEDRCGSTTDPERRTMCSCDRYCGYYGDCCQDIREHCPKEYRFFHSLSARFPSLHAYDDFKCQSFETFQNLMIHTCPDGTQCEFTDKFGTDLNTFVPMYEINKGIHYISGQCALCNRAVDVTPWNFTVICRRKDEDYFNSATTITSSEYLQTVLDLATCEISYSVPQTPRNCFDDVISSCPDSCQNDRLVTSCETDFQSLTISGYTAYRNVYCAACNAEQGVTDKNLTCDWSVVRNPTITHMTTPLQRDMKDFSLTLVFDFDPGNGLTVRPPECAAGKVFVPNENKCRPITCQSGFILDGSDCVPEPSTITAVLKGTLKKEPSAQMMATLYQDKTHLENNVKESTINTMDTFNVTHSDLEVTSSFQHINNSLRTEIILKCSCDFSVLYHEDDKKRKFREEFEQKVRNQVVQYLFPKNMHLTSVTMTTDFRLPLVTDLNKQQSNCTFLVYQMNEIRVTNDTVIIISTGKTYASGKYQMLEDEVVIVCETDLNESGADDMDDTSFALSILTLICVGISIICLGIRVVLQFYITSFKSRAGKLQLHLTVAFLIAFVMLIVGVFLSDMPDACTTAAILLAYGFLAAFIWMNVIAIDTWLIFRPSAAFSRAEKDKRSLRWHCIFGWGIPILLVSISIVTNFAGVYQGFSPEFGGPRCWYTRRYAMLLYFGVPLMLSSAMNAALFILTSFNLHMAFNNGTNVIKSEGRHFRIYVRLFVLMGITWIFGFISAFTDELVIDFIFVILNSLQGLFLFISFVCNKRVLAEIRQKTKGETSSTYGKQTKSTPLNSNSNNDSTV